MEHLDIVSGKYGVFSIGPRDGVCEHIARGEFWDSWLLPYLDELKPEDVYVGVGEHVGLMSIYAAQKCKWVHAFEPQNINYERLVKNVELNNLINVTCYNVALYNKETKMSVNGYGSQNQIVYDGGRNSACSLSLGENPAGDIAAKTLDSYNLTVSFIKSDAESCDMAVLEGSIETIKRCSPKIIFEWSERGNRYVEFFQGLNYNIKEVAGQNYLATPR